MKKSRKQRKLETAKRVAREEAERIQRRKRITFDVESGDNVIMMFYPDIHKGKPKFKKIETGKIIDEMFPSELKPAEPVKPLHYITMAAILDKRTGEIFIRDTGTYHADLCSEFNIMETDNNFVFGFLDNFNKFHNRAEAGEIAYNANQCSEYYRNSLQSNGFRRII